MSSPSRYTPEFKAEAIRQVVELKLSIPQVASHLQMREKTLRSWVKASTPSEETPEKELARLRKEVERLKMERDLLKKATAFFARESR